MQIRKTYLEKGKSKFDLRILGVFCSRNKDLYVQKNIAFLSNVFYRNIILTYEKIIF